jgi:hypothetical protein
VSAEGDTVDVEALMGRCGGSRGTVPVTHCWNPGHVADADAHAAAVGPDLDAAHLRDLPCEVLFQQFAEHLVAMRDPTQRRAAKTLMYLKDWHVLRDHADPAAPPPYSCPAIFQDDYLNEFSLAHRGGDDYRFVYVGPAQTRTLLHTDVLGSYSWSTSVVGRKRWTFFPPEARGLLVDSHGRILEDIDGVDPVRFPRYAEAVAVATVVVQTPGQTVFVPSGWVHQVENLDECLSVNANWVNGCNLERFVATVADDLRVAQHEIADVRAVMVDDWHTTCHHMVRTNCGFDFEMVCELIAAIYERVASELATAASVPKEPASDELGEQKADVFKLHKIFELVQLDKALTTVLALWSAALDPSATIAPKHTRLAADLSRQCLDASTSGLGIS